MISSGLFVIFGLLLVIRTYFAVDRSVSKKNLMMLMIFLLLAAITIRFLAAYIVGVVLLCMLPMIQKRWQILVQSKKQAADEDILLDYLILQMKSGFALKSALKSLNGDQQHHLNSVAEQVLSTKSDRFVIQNLQLVLSSDHQQLFRLQSLRRVHALQKSIRQRSRKTSTQARAQSHLLCLVYAGLIVFQILQMQTKEGLYFIVGSLALFILGMAWSHQMQRGFQWKI